MLNGSSSKQKKDGIILSDLLDVETLFITDKEKSKGGFISKLLKKDKKSIIVATILLILQCSPVYLIPVFTSNVIDAITLRYAGYINHVIMNIALALFIVCLNSPFTYLRSKVINKTIRTTSAQVKSTLVRKLQKLSITFHKEIEEGKIQSKFLRDMETVERYYNTLLSGVIYYAILIVAFVTIVAFTNPIMLLFYVVLIPLNLLIVKLLRNKIKNQSKEFRKENEDLSAKITTSIQMLSLTKAHGLTTEEISSVNNKIQNATNAGLNLDKTNSIFGTFLWMTGQFSSLVCLLICVILAINNVISVGEVLLFQSSFNNIRGSIDVLTSYIPELAKGAESIRSLSEIMCADELEDDKGQLPVPSIKGEFDFVNVTYNYPRADKTTISNFNLHVNAGETVAFVGPSGSGKTTIINLIIGLLSPSQGQILVDGKPLSEMPLEKYRKFISVVPQNSILFSGSIRQNITYGMDYITEKQLLKAVEDSGVAEFLPSLPNGLDSSVGEHGDKLSGGQKQRVSIARALIRQPKILILDEATSALDNVSELHIQKAIEKVSDNRTTFIVAHRLSTIRNADKIVVMEEGKIVEVGTYEELVNNNGKFYELEKLSHIHDSLND